MENQTQKLRNKLIEAAEKSESDELLEAALEILDSPPDTDIWASPEIKQAWIEEADRRARQMESGEVEGIPGEEVFRKIDEMLGK